MNKLVLNSAGTSGIDCVVAAIMHTYLRHGKVDFITMAFDSVDYKSPQKLAHFPVRLIIPHVTNISIQEPRSFTLDLKAGKFKHLDHVDYTTLETNIGAGNALNVCLGGIAAIVNEKQIETLVAEAIKKISDGCKKKSYLNLMTVAGTPGGTAPGCFGKTEEILAKDYCNSGFKCNLVNIRPISAFDDSELSSKHRANTYGAIVELSAAFCGCCQRFTLHKHGLGQVTSHCPPGCTLLVSNQNHKILTLEELHATVGKVIEVVSHEPMLEASRKLFTDLQENIPHRHLPTSNTIGFASIHTGTLMENQYRKNRLVAHVADHATTPLENAKRISAETLKSRELIENEHYRGISPRFIKEKGKDVVKLVLRYLERIKPNCWRAKQSFMAMEETMSDINTNVLPLFEKSTQKKKERITKQVVDFLLDCYAQITKSYHPGAASSMALEVEKSFKHSAKYVESTCANLSQGKKDLEAKMGKLRKQILSCIRLPFIFKLFRNPRCLLKLYKEYCIQYVTILLRQIIMKATGEVLTATEPIRKEFLEKVDAGVNEMINICNKARAIAEDIETTNFEYLGLNVCLNSSSRFKKQYMKLGKENEALKSVMPGIVERFHQYCEVYDQRYLAELSAYLDVATTEFMQKQNCLAQGDVWQTLNQMSNSTELIDEWVRKSSILMSVDKNKGEGVSAALVGIKGGMSNPHAPEIESALRKNGLRGEIRVVDYPWPDEGVIIGIEFGRLSSTLHPLRQAREEYLKLSLEDRVTCHTDPFAVLYPDPLNEPDVRDRRQLLVRGIASGLIQTNNGKAAYRSHDNTIVEATVDELCANLGSYRDQVHVRSNYAKTIREKGFRDVHERLKEMYKDAYKDETLELSRELKALARVCHQNVE